MVPDFPASRAQIQGTTPRGCKQHPWIPVPEDRLSSSPSFNTSLLRLVPDFRRISVYLPPVPIDPIVEGWL